MDIHILSAFYRTHFIKTLIHYYEPENIIYHAIVAPERNATFDVDWMRPVYTKELYPGEQCYRKFNDFIDTQPIIDNDYYGFVCDECVYEPGFFDVIRQQTAKIIMYSSYRGDSIPNDGSPPHPAEPLIIKEYKDVYAGHIGLGQFIVNGEILKQMRFKLHDESCDGYFAEELVKRFATDIVFLPNWFLFANYLQPGRHTKKNSFLKPHWELPKIIT